MDKNMEYGSDYTFIPATSVGSDTGSEVAPDVYYHTIQIVNIGFIAHPDNGWILVDAGMPNSAEKIISVAEEHFGSHPPSAIILTHGHFDHVGAIIELVNHWNVPVYAHESELPFLTGQKRYPEPDPSVEGGLIAKISPLFPNEPINLNEHIQPLPSNGDVPFLSGWRWMHTPGHTPGHVSLFRENDRVLIAGDAFVTVKQESLYRVFSQEQEISGPPRYFTPDWQQAWESVKKLAALQPSVALTGHGLPMSGELLNTSLTMLANEFDRIAIPEYGKYVRNTDH